MAVPSELTANANGISVETLLSDWRPLVSGSFTPVVMTALGDLFLRDAAGHIHFLDLTYGKFDQVATSQEQFDRLCEVSERRRSWFFSHLIIELRKLHGELKAGQCFGCKEPVWLGGKLEASNFERTSILVYYSLLGQLFHQARVQSPGN